MHARYTKPLRTNFPATAEGEIQFADAAVRYMDVCRAQALEDIAAIDAAKPTPQMDATERMRIYKRAARIQGPTLHDALQESPLLLDLYKRGLLFKNQS